MSGAILTNRQREVLWLVSYGHTRNEIADNLGISPETVKDHMRDMRWRLGARTNSQAVAYGFQKGILL